MDNSAFRITSKFVHKLAGESLAKERDQEAY